MIRDEVITKAIQVIGRDTLVKYKFTVGDDFIMFPDDLTKDGTITVELEKYAHGTAAVIIKRGSEEFKLLRILLNGEVRMYNRFRIVGQQPLYKIIDRLAQVKAGLKPAIGYVSEDNQSAVSEWLNQNVLATLTCWNSTQIINCDYDFLSNKIIPVDSIDDPQIIEAILYYIGAYCSDHSKLPQHDNPQEAYLMLQNEGMKILTHYGFTILDDHTSIRLPDLRSKGLQMVYDQTDYGSRIAIRRERQSFDLMTFEPARDDTIRVLLHNRFQVLIISLTSPICKIIDRLSEPDRWGNRPSIGHIPTEKKMLVEGWLMSPKNVLETMTCSDPMDMIYQWLTMLPERRIKNDLVSAHIVMPMLKNDLVSAHIVMTMLIL